MVLICFKYAVLSVPCSLVIICWERSGLLALVCVLSYEFFTLPYGVYGQVWYLSVSIPDLCLLHYFILTFRHAFVKCLVIHPEFHMCI